LPALESYDERLHAHADAIQRSQPTPVGPDARAAQDVAAPLNTNKTVCF